MSETRETNLTIISMSGELSKSSIYKMTRSPKVQSVSKLEDGTVITVNEWLEYQDKNAKGEMVNVFAFIEYEKVDVKCTSIGYFWKKLRESLSKSGSTLL